MSQKEEELVKTVEKYVAGENGEVGDDEALRSLGGAAQDFARKWKVEASGQKAVGNEDMTNQVSSKHDNKKDQDEEGGYGRGSHGHGPVVRQRGGRSGRGGKGTSYMQDG